MLGALGMFTRPVTDDDHIGVAVRDAKYTNFRAFLTIRSIHGTLVRLTNVQSSVFINVSVSLVF